MVSEPAQNIVSGATKPLKSFELEAEAKNAPTDSPTDSSVEGDDSSLPASEADLLSDEKSNGSGRVPLTPLPPD